MAIYSEFSHEKMVIFNSYVKLPEGTIVYYNICRHDMNLQWAFESASAAKSVPSKVNRRSEGVGNGDNMQLLWACDRHMRLGLHGVFQAWHHTINK